MTHGTHVVEALADAIMHYEGWNAGSRSYRNRNPGNLRASSAMQEVDPDGYRTFWTLEEGYNALCSDLAHKIDGRNAHDLGPDSTLLDLLKVYAPAGDHNKPVTYAAFVATWLRQVYNSATIMTDTQLRDVFAIAGQEVPHGVTRTEHPEPVPVTESEVPADRVASGPEPAVEDLAPDPAIVGGEPGSGSDGVGLSNDRSQAEAGAGGSVEGS